MKAIMISIKPKWCALIMNGEKTIEVRKNKALASAIQKLIDENGYADIYAYCSKNEYLYRTNKGYFASKKPLAVGKGTDYTFAYSDEGKVVFKFRCYKIRSIIKRYIPKDSFIYSSSGCLLSQDSCLSYEELDNCLKAKIGETKGYAIHISDLEIFDKPKWLIDFKTKVYPNKKDSLITKTITKAPQNFCYVEVE